MQIETTKKLFSVEDYHRMAEAGILGPDDRLELIDGEVLEMSPIGDRHAVAVNIATNRFAAVFGSRVFLSVQNPLRLNDHTELQPDIVLLKYRDDFYRDRMWTAKEVLLVLEVSDTTLRYDRMVKLPQFATAGVPEVWIESLAADELLVFRGLSDRSYSTALTFRRDDLVSTLAFPEVSFRVGDLLP